MEKKEISIRRIADTKTHHSGSLNRLVPCKSVYRRRNNKKTYASQSAQMTAGKTAISNYLGEQVDMESLGEYRPTKDSQCLNYRGNTIPAAYINYNKAFPMEDNVAEFYFREGSDLLKARGTSYKRFHVVKYGPALSQHEATQCNRSVIWYDGI
ncbi:hypothetical protein KIN20_001364 [Parelaphostrongylus tenuis]|uniref:Uncharacterized protein n=1 Tax=Parelaphostrongylus tenuis TaxID=148309 RepID=A0AAD5LTJ7_PARTN|nr:hypothetical protein KIN20_001364 [Parelaphostrongylus tenuis]